MVMGNRGAGKRLWYSGYRFGVGYERFKSGLGLVTGKDQRQQFRIDEW